MKICQVFTSTLISSDNLDCENPKEMFWKVTRKRKIRFDKQPEKGRGKFTKELSRKPQNVIKVKSFLPFKHQ